MSEIPAYLSISQLLDYLGISDDTLRRWRQKGFPEPGRHGRWQRAKVDRYMDGKVEPALPSDGRADQIEEIRNASAAFFATHH